MSEWGRPAKNGRRRTIPPKGQVSLWDCSEYTGFDTDEGAEIWIHKTRNEYYYRKVVTYKRGLLGMSTPELHREHLLDCHNAHRGCQVKLGNDIDDEAGQMISGLISGLILDLPA